MKYLTLFEKYTSDDERTLNYILDKIKNYGKESLSRTELSFLDELSKDGSYQELSDNISKSKTNIKSFMDFDPREDEELNDLASELGLDLSDEDIEDGKYQILWNELDDESFKHFLQYSKINPADLKNEDGDFYGSFDYLSTDTINKFKFFVDNIL